MEEDAEPRDLREPREAAVDTVWTLMDPALFDRVTRGLGWDVERYAHWVADALTHLLIPERT